MKFKFTCTAMILIICTFLTGVNVTKASADTFTNWITAAVKIEAALKGALKTYTAGKSDEAMEQVADAYFVVFESENANMEIAVRRFIGLKKAASLEKSFTDIRRAIYNKEPLEKVSKMVEQLSIDLREASKLLDDKNISLKDIKF